MEKQFEPLFTKWHESIEDIATGTDLVDIGLSFIMLGLAAHCDDAYKKAADEAKVVGDAMRIMGQGFARMAALEEIIGRDKLRDLLESQKDEIQKSFETLLASVEAKTNKKPH